MYKFILLLVLFFTFSCQIPEKYQVTGVIKKIDTTNNQLLIDHDEILGFMDPMIMYFKTHKSIDLNIFEIGDSVLFDLVIHKKNSYTLNYKNLGKTNKLNQSDNFWDEEDSKYKLKEPGDFIDDVTFLNLDGEEVKLSNFNKNFTVISFIFSRCPMPNMCPAAIVKNQYLSEYFKDNNMNFLLISFDYIFDTPTVLYNVYGELEKDNLHFLSSHQHLNDLFTLSQQSGVAFWGIEENNIGHSMRTLVIDKNLKVLKTFDGMDWKPGDAKKDIENLMKIYQ